MILFNHWEVESNMLVRDLLHKIMSKEMKIKDVATMYGVSDRTIQSKIKKLGYEWDSKNSVYHYVLEEPEPLEVDFSTLFGRKQNSSKRIAKKEVNRGEVEAAATSIASKKVVKNNEDNNEYQLIDSLLDNKPKSNKLYRGFYLDEEIVNIIDRVEKRKKSELVNEALKIVFRNRGLL